MNKENDNVKLDYEILNNVQNSIKSFDNKAGILASIMGIVFGLSLFFLDTFKNILSLVSADDSIIYKRYVSFAIIYGIFLLVSFLTICCSLLVIFPRKNKRETRKNNINYYLDLSKMNYESYEDNKKEWTTSSDAVWKQIKINSIICKKKHNFLRASILLFILSMILFTILVFLHIIFVR